MLQLHQNQKGSVMVITALSMVALIAMAGLSLDLGKLFVSRLVVSFI